MPEFIYKARDRQGALMKGVLTGPDEESVIGSLDRMGYSVVMISQKVRTASKGGVSFFDRFKKLSRREVIVFTRQLATLLRTGTALLPALTTICDQTANHKFKRILEEIQQTVQSGKSFSEALEAYPAVFSELFVSMVQVGETGGMLDKVLDRLASLGTQEMEMSSRIQSAMIYPIVLVSIAFIVVNFLMIGVLPKFVSVFRASETALPLPTQIVMGISWIGRKLWFPISLAITAIVFWFRAYIKTDKGKFRMHKIWLKFPIFGPLYNKIQITRFSRILSSLLSSGIPILQALVVVEKTISNVILRRAIQNVRISIGEGHSLADPFAVSGLFPPIVISMIATGEKSGNLDVMLNEVAEFYEPEIENTVKNLTTLLEPFMLLVMGLIVAFIALSVLLPIFNLISVFRG